MMPVELPHSLEAVEDWGFAHMKNLREIALPAKMLTFGKQVFLGCDRLERVRLFGAEIYQGISYFLASMFRFFPEQTLENLEQAGDVQGQWQWLARYDRALLEYLNRPEDDGFVPAFIGWFDVEDVDEQKQHYMLEQRKNKLILVFQRLMYNEKLSEEDEIFLSRRLQDEDMLVEELLLQREELGRDVRYYRIWEQWGGLNPERCARLLDRLPQEEPEIRGYLLKLQLENVDKQDFFAELDL